ncbi:hypothetical protein, partial [Actinomadura napierensis]|uniref:hypothetical protein n=1 Tax=Actinomadura napierensis TaxID=267854 RepID=UPI0031CE20BC
MPPDSDAASAWAASGAVVLSGRSDGPPLLPPGRAAAVARDLAGRFAGITGAPRLDGARLLSERAAFTGHRRRGRVSPGGA